MYYYVLFTLRLYCVALTLKAVTDSFQYCQELHDSLKDLY